MKTPWIETPLIESPALSKTAGCRVFLKLELLQPSGSFKSRGIGFLILQNRIDPANHGKELHFYCSSGGNAGLAAAMAARDVGCACTVVVPHSTTPAMIQKIRVAGATEVLQHGSSWYEADIYLREKFIDNQCDAADRKNIYVPPFEHEYIRAGAAGIVSEIANQLLPRENTTDGDFPADAIVCSVGGGGLFNGIVRGLDEFFQFPKPPNVIRNGPKDVYVITTETFGAHSLAYSLEHGSLQTLPAITSQATSLGALRVATKTFENAVSPPAGIQVRSVLGTDMEAADGVVLLSDEHRLQVELACGISVFVAGTLNTYNIVPDLTPDSRVVVVVCGGSNINAEMIAEYRQKLSTGWN